MAKSTYHPSEMLPDFFKTDLRVGEVGTFPLVGFLDDFADRLACAAFLGTMQLISETASEVDQRQRLEHLGFEVSTLDASQVMSLYARREEILSARGQLDATRILASIYFPASRVTVGLTPIRERLGTSIAFRLADVQSGRRIFVRLADAASEAAKSEFVSNAARLLPVPYEVALIDPHRSTDPKPRLCLGTPRSWEKRRLECLISHK